MNINSDMIPLDKAVKASNRVVQYLDERDTNVYVTIAKAALWVVSAILLLALVVAWKDKDLSLVVQTCQVIVFVAATVLGFHEYRGSRIFHILRHWDGGNDDTQDT